MNRHNMNFTGKRIWVTGAGRGIGFEIANSFVSKNANVIGIDKTFPLTNRYSFTCLQIDLCDVSQIEQTVSRLLISEQGIDVLVNAAGILRLGYSDTISVDDWQLSMDVNVNAVYHLYRLTLPWFKQQRSGSIVTIASNAAHVPRLNMAAYCASKAAVVSLTKTVALELAEYGVRCNLVSPGSTLTPMLQSMWQHGQEEKGKQQLIEGLPQDYKLGIPLKKIASPQDISHTVLFLASDLASHITMQDIVIDGGATLGA